ncbi:MAG: hypothetical protein KDD42_07310 [Bdellovibrionales bacterium]|nr:hypothetical protein [Bdellovibrionales bacterium]
MESKSLQNILGVNQWFHYEDKRGIERSIEYLDELGVKLLRTGISWADYHRPGGPQWYDFQMEALSHLKLLVSVWHTPPSISMGGNCASPPKNLHEFADFIDVILSRYGERIEVLELWNEPNNRYKWDFERFDPDWSKFSEMIRTAAHWAAKVGQRTALGGIIPVDPDWLANMKQRGALEKIDLIAIHGFPEMWWENAPNWDWHSHWHGWPEKIDKIKLIAEERPIWITETGLATYDLDRRQVGRHQLQAEMLEIAASAPAERIYWYSLIDLDPSRAAIEGFHVDENEYHMGLVTFEGERKPAYWKMQNLLCEQRDE